MSRGSRVVASLFTLTCVWGSYELYHKMRLEDFLSFPAIGYAILSVGCVVLGTLINQAARGD